MSEIKVFIVSHKVSSKMEAIGEDPIIVNAKGFAVAIAIEAFQNKPLN